ncbi:hypothetical protein NPIL_155401 [Nephila pilipes]|uniref:Uncharacterized protein n=1 Tax=Nephila pilipes TaxID=299642 RepID=A0A8X6MXN8_NEPPI|nr:hypothetical protein NPIL_155401 [Nephila pilipes]
MFVYLARQPQRWRSNKWSTLFLLPYPPVSIRVDYPIPVLLLATEAFARSVQIPFLALPPYLRPRVFLPTPVRGERQSRLTNEREPQPSSSKNFSSRSSAFQRCMFLRHRYYGESRWNVW